MSTKNRFIITKKITKHGNQAIIIVPRLFEDKLKPGTIVELVIDVVK